MDEKKKLVISNRDPATIRDFYEVLHEIESSLINLRTLAKSTNFSNKEERKYYKDNVAYLKLFYERAESLALAYD